MKNFRLPLLFLRVRIAVAVAIIILDAIAMGVDSVRHMQQHRRVYDGRRGPPTRWRRKDFLLLLRISCMPTSRTTNADFKERTNSTHSHPFAGIMNEPRHPNNNLCISQLKRAFCNYDRVAKRKEIYLSLVGRFDGLVPMHIAAWVIYVGR